FLFFFHFSVNHLFFDLIALGVFLAIECQKRIPHVIGLKKVRLINMPNREEGHRLPLYHFYGIHPARYLTKDTVRMTFQKSLFPH
ncbi:hypothetical protein, partial [Salmonella enterica]